MLFLVNMMPVPYSFTCVEMLCGGGDVPVLDTFVLLVAEEDGRWLVTSRGGDVPVDFFWTFGVITLFRGEFSLGGDGPTDILCLFTVVGISLLSRKGDTLIVLLESRGGDISVLVSRFACLPFRTSLGGDGPTAISFLSCKFSS